MRWSREHCPRGSTGTRWSLWPQHPLTMLGWAADRCGEAECGAGLRAQSPVRPASMLRSPACHRCWRTPTRPQAFLWRGVAPSAGSPRTLAECRGSVDPAPWSGVTMWAAAPRRALLLLASVHATASPSTPAADITNGSLTPLQMPGAAHMWPTGQSGDPGDPKGERDSFCPGKIRPQHAASWHLCFGTDWSLTGVLSPQQAAPWAGCSVSAHGVRHVLAQALGLCPTFLPTGTSGAPHLPLLGQPPPLGLQFWLSALDRAAWKSLQGGLRSLGGAAGQ